MAARVPDMFCNFYLVKNHTIGNNSTTTEAWEKGSADLEFIEFKFFLMLLQLKSKAKKFHSIQLDTDFYWKPSYLMVKIFPYSNTNIFSICSIKYFQQGNVTDMVHLLVLTSLD